MRQVQNLDCRWDGDQAYRKGQHRDVAFIGLSRSTILIHADAAGAKTSCSQLFFYTEGRDKRHALPLPSTKPLTELDVLEI